MTSRVSNTCQTTGSRPDVDVGCWFLVPESEIRRLRGRRRGSPFTSKPGRRPVVLARLTAARGKPILFPRSTLDGERGEERRPHSKHAHSKTDRRCRITRRGWVILGMAVTVAPQHLSAATFSCREPEGTGLMAAIDRRVPA